MVENNLSHETREEILEEVKNELKKEGSLSDKRSAEMIKKIDKKLKIKQAIVNKTKEFNGEFKKQISTAIIAAFGLIIALSWREVINDTVSKFAFVKEYGLLITAIIMTMISVIAIFIISQWIKPKEIKK